MGVEENLQLMQTLDNAWNGKDWETFMKRHSENVAVYWPGQPKPTRGRHAHHNESVEYERIASANSGISAGAFLGIDLV
jgi:hypothetical protein